MLAKPTMKKLQYNNVVALPLGSKKRQRSSFRAGTSFQSL